MVEFDPIEKHFLDRARESSYALWSALLTVNGVMISGFSVLRVAVPTASPLLVSLLVACAAASLLLVVWNFFVTKQQYQVSGGRIVNEEYELTEGRKEKEVREAERQHTYTLNREQAALILLGAEVLAVVVLLCRVASR